jgi:23S rRNA (guanosine2251-2'-O)-methyltransferase
MRDRARRPHGERHQQAQAEPRTDLVYGLQPVREALRGFREVREVVCTDAAYQSMPWLGESGARISRAVESAVTALAERPDHQGVVAICEPYPYADAEAVLARPDALVVILDGVTDPRNLGAIVRTCECAGASGIVVPRHGSAGVTAVVAKASAGAVEHLPVALATNLAELLRRSKRPDLWSYAAEAGSGAAPWDIDLTGGSILVLGSEGSGIRPRVRAACDAGVSIPLGGVVESLNVGVAAGMLLYEAQRQRALAQRAG